tara:strand:+ start:797 stop:1426 length:630 start_codon:yes stop_codon:yes gene_type:complete
MLYKETVERSTLELIIQLQQKEYLQDFYLVGGTALALRMGYRKSIDIDLFSNFTFDAGRLLENLSADFPFKLFFSANNTLKGSINNVQIDILAHCYPIIGKPVIVENITIMSYKDIVAMKLNAISVSGQRVKDFIDLYYLLDKYSVAEMIAFYEKKYPQYNETNVLKSITWFDDVDLSDWPVLLENPKLKWETVKERIINASSEFLSQI